MDKPQNTTENQDACLELTEEKLFQFSQTQQAQFTKQALEGSATSATLICAFFMGAAETFASDDEVLQLSIAKLINMDERGTRHLIDTTHRLSNKYPFVNDVIKLGQQIAASWQAHDGHNNMITLTQLLEQNQNQSLMDLVKNGVIRTEPDPTTTRASVNQTVEKNPRLKRLLLILLALIILVSANYVTLTVLAK